jgi:hypothetical protein
LARATSSRRSDARPIVGITTETSLSALAATATAAKQERPKGEGVE